MIRNHQGGKMKNKQITTLILAGLALSTSAATPAREKIYVQDVYTPEGFNVYENSQVVVTGVLPNLCHKSPKVSKEIKDNQIKIELTSLVYDQSNPFCPEAVLPFKKTIDLGELKKGDYEVIINDGTDQEKRENLRVDGIDPVNLNPDRIYANVTDIEIDNNDPAHITLKAYNPSTCFEMDKLTINLDQEGTYTVSPVMRQRDEFCAYKMVPFDIDVNLPLQEGDKNILLHVKTMDGDSLNRIINPQVL